MKLSKIALIGVFAATSALAGVVQCPQTVSCDTNGYSIVCNSRSNMGEDYTYKGIRYIGKYNFRVASIPAKGANSVCYYQHQNVSLSLAVEYKGSYVPNDGLWSKTEAVAKCVSKHSESCSFIKQ